MKTCNICKEEKPLPDFCKSKYTKDGLNYHCRACNALRNKIYNSNNKEKNDLVNKKYKQNNKEKYLVYVAAYRSRNPIKEKAHGLLNYAIKRGDIVRGVCPCGSTKRAHGHHDDYACPLVVRWLCHACHFKWHSEHGSGANG